MVSSGAASLKQAGMAYKAAQSAAISASFHFPTRIETADYHSVVGCAGFGSAIGSIAIGIPQVFATLEYVDSPFRGLASDLTGRGAVRAPPRVLSASA